MEVIYGNKKSDKEINIPKNVKLYGKNEGKKRVYIEDYVYTYLYQIAAANEEKETMAILLGSIENFDTEISVYAEGAIEIKYHLCKSNTNTIKVRNVKNNNEILKSRIENYQKMFLEIEDLKEKY